MVWSLAGMESDAGMETEPKDPLSSKNLFDKKFGAASGIQKPVHQGWPLCPNKASTSTVILFNDYHGIQTSQRMYKEVLASVLCEAREMQ